jgi:hypothetical protein
VPISSPGNTGFFGDKIVFRTPSITDRRIAVNPSRANFDLTCAILGVFVALLPIAAVAIALAVVS